MFAWLRGLVARSRAPGVVLSEIRTGGAYSRLVLIREGEGSSERIAIRYESIIIPYLWTHRATFRLEKDAREALRRAIG